MPSAPRSLPAASDAPRVVAFVDAEFRPNRKMIRDFQGLFLREVVAPRAHSATCHFQSLA